MQKSLVKGTKYINKDSGMGVAIYTNTLIGSTLEMFTLPAWLDRQKITNLVIKN
jgi:hypothetical protein